MFSSFPSKKRKKIIVITRWKRNNGVDSLIYPSKLYTDTTNLFGCVMENSAFFSFLRSPFSLSLQANNQIVKWMLKMDGKNDYMNTSEVHTMKYGINIRGMLLHKHVKQWIYNRAWSENGWLRTQTQTHSHSHIHTYLASKQTSKQVVKQPSQYMYEVHTSFYRTPPFVPPILYAVPEKFCIVYNIMWTCNTCRCL